jgi:hypothetical protein
VKQIFIFRLTSLSMFLALVACQRSAQPTQPLFSDAQLTSIASTAQASLLQTQAAYTPTPIPPTSTPKVSAISSSSLALHEDRTTLFVDHKAGIQLILPADWLTVRVNEDEYYKAYALEPVINNKDITDRLTQFQSTNPDFFRLAAIDVQVDHDADGVVPDITVIFQKDDNRTLEAWLQAERGAKKPIQGYKFLSSTYQKTANFKCVLIIEESWNIGKDGTAYYRGVFFNLPTGAVVLDFQLNKKFKDELLPVFMQVVDSLTLLNQ